MHFSISMRNFLSFMGRGGLLGCVFICLASQVVYAGEPLYKLGEKTYTTDDLGPAEKQALYNIDASRYRQIENLLDQALLTKYFEEKAKKSKKTSEELEAEEFKPIEPSEKEIKKFYEENKNRIPPGYTYDKVKPELQKMLMGQAVNEKKEALVAKLKKQQKFQFVMTEPEVPQVQLQVEEFYRKGKKGAKVKIVEFADYQCPHCREASVAFNELMKKYNDRVELVFVDFPINRSGISRTVAEGGYCASKQNKYWEYHEAAFNEQAKLSNDSPVELAKKLKLNEADFKKCIASAEAKSFVSKGKDEGARVGVSGTPTIFINGKRYNEAHTYDEMKKAVDRIL